MPLPFAGYTATVLGVRSSCRLKQMDWLDVSQYLVEVVPALPQLQVSSRFCWGIFCWI